MIADHVQRMLRAHQRRRDGDLPAAGGVRNETRPGAGCCDSARERGSARGHGTQGSDVRRTRRSRRVAGEGLGLGGWALVTRGHAHCPRPAVGPRALSLTLGLADERPELPTPPR